MRVNTDWLKQYTEIPYTPEELSNRLTEIGLEATIVDESANLPDSVIIAIVATVDKHPRADRLSVCKVNTGEREYTVVCGAPNVTAGQRVPLALPGAVLPGGQEIKAATIRGVFSEGMLCAEDELKLSDDHSGIMVLDESAPIGMPLREFLQKNGVSLEIELTPNRPDCASQIGIAREISLLTGSQLILPPVNLPEGNVPTSNEVAVVIEDAEACPRYAARLIRQVQVGPSPQWLVRRLNSVGLRSINNIVDAANFVLMETGHPLHTFDLAQVKEQKIVVRRARAGEKVMTLDGMERSLTPEILLICDAVRPVAIAGIMGLANSEITDRTTDVLIESAYFNPKVIRRGARFLGLQTDASYRFERGADIEGVIYALNRVAQIITEVAGGEVCRGIVDNYPGVSAPRRVQVNYHKIDELIGMEFDRNWLVDLFRKLGCKTERITAEGVSLEVPSWRQDLEREVDFGEEAVRIYGMSRVPSAKKLSIQLRGAVDERYDRIESLRSRMMAFGFDEIYTNSLISAEKSRLNFDGYQPVALQNPLSIDLSHLRTALFPGMLQAVKNNINHRRLNLRLFELGFVQLRDTASETGAQEKLHLGAVVCGETGERHWSRLMRQSDLFVVKGLIEGLLKNMRLALPTWNPIERPECKILLKTEIAGRVLAYLGEFNPTFLRELVDIEVPVFFIEMDVDLLLEQPVRPVKFRELPIFPAVQRDISIVLDARVPVADVVAKIQSSGGEYLREVLFYDLYTGKNIDKSKKSLTFNLVFWALERTLTDAEIDKAMTRIHQVLNEEFQARLR